MPTKKSQEPYATTVEVDNFTRDDITALAKVYGRKSGIPGVSRKQYLTVLIAREKTQAVANGDIKA